MERVSEAFHEEAGDERVGRTGHLDPRCGHVLRLGGHTVSYTFADTPPLSLSLLTLVSLSFRSHLTRPAPGQSDSNTVFLFFFVADTCDRSRHGLPFACTLMTTHDELLPFLRHFFTIPSSTLICMLYPHGREFLLFSLPLFLSFFLSFLYLV